MKKREQRCWERLVLGGVVQYVCTRRRAKGLPYLLFLHGGPGGASFGPNCRYLRELSADWTWVDWEQRGAGRSFDPAAALADLSLERLIQDGLELARLLVARNGGRPIVLAGHSAGTVLGVRMVQREPGLFAAWAGAAQVADWPAQELLSTRWTRDQALRRGHAMALADLEKLGMPVDGQYPGGAAGLTRQRRWLGNFGGVSAEPSFALRWMLSILAAPAYPLGDKLRYARAMEGSMERLWPALGLTRLAADCRELAVPVHVFQGRQDRITDPGLVRDWLAVLKAPSIRLVEAESAGHLCLYEQAAAYREFLRGLAP